jgi:hypothetical protein
VHALGFKSTTETLTCDVLILPRLRASAAMNSADGNDEAQKPVTFMSDSTI